MPHPMEDIMEHSGHMPGSDKAAFSGQQRITIQKSLSGDASMSETWEHQLMRCNASHEQSPSGTL
jgi:hypothetical protein